MVTSPRLTLTNAIRNPRSVDLGILIVVVSALCSAGFLMTRVGRLASLDQQVRQLESFGVMITDQQYEQLRAIVPYRPLISAGMIVLGWPLLWLVTARVLQWIGNRGGRREASFGHVLTIVVHASAILALRALVAAPINYARESIGGATSLSLIMPAFGQSTFPARLLGAIDIFILWWVVLVALGLSILYETRTVPIARWLFGAYAGGAAALALTQAFRGGL